MGNISVLAPNIKPRNLVQNAAEKTGITKVLAQKLKNVQSADMLLHHIHMQKLVHITKSQSGLFVRNAEELTIDIKTTAPNMIQLCVQNVVVKWANTKKDVLNMTRKVNGKS